MAYAIHPPVLSDRGLLEAIEAQSTRLAVPMAVAAPTPVLRGVRFGTQIEATAWYVLAEALSNVVKHARASEVEVSLARRGTLGLVIRDDGCGFDPGRPRGLGLTGLSRARLDTVGGSVTISSGAGRGTSVCVSIPVGRQDRWLMAVSLNGPQDGPLRIVMADEDNYLVREGARRLLEDSGDITVEAAVGSAPELLDAVKRLRQGRGAHRHPDAARQHRRASRCGVAARHGGHRRRRDQVGLPADRRRGVVHQDELCVRAVGDGTGLPGLWKMAATWARRFAGASRRAPTNSWPR